MTRLRVLEFIRDPAGTWTLPGRHVDALRAAFPEVIFESPPDRAEADHAIAEADIVLGYAVTRENLGRAKRLRWIQITSAGVPESLQFPELVESSVVLTNGRGLFSAPMAEHALAMMLAFARKLHLSRDAQRGRQWMQSEFEKDEEGFAPLRGATLGIVGFGSIGAELAERAAALGMRVIGLRRHPAATPAPAHAQWGPERMGDLFSECDWVVVTLPLTRDTRGLIGRREFSRMRERAVFLNLGRGAVVDEAALIDGLRSGRPAAAGLDVFEEEPLDPGSPLWDLPNVIVTPHTSGFAPGLWDRAMALFSRNLRAHLEGRPLENVVDKRAGY